MLRRLPAGLGYIMSQTISLSDYDHLDLAFLLDSSGSIMRDNWQGMLNVTGGTANKGETILEAESATNESIDIYVVGVGW